MIFNIIDLENICIQSIKEYLNRPITDEEVKNKYRVALTVMIEETKEILSNKQIGISSVTQGSQSISFNETVQAFKVNESVKALLPKPNIKVI